MPREQKLPLPRSLAEVAWQELREEIFSGQLKPGTPLVLTEQAQRLGMSIMPIREAIAKLQMEGIVLQEPQRGATVAPISLGDMEDVYNVRVLLETMAVRLACARITRTDYQALHDTLDYFVEEYRKGNDRGGREHHRRFHLGLYEISQSRTLNRVIPPLLDNSERYRVLSITTRGSLADRWREHHDILDACMSRDVATAEGLLTEHLRRTLRLVKEAIATSKVAVDDSNSLSRG